MPPDVTAQAAWEQAGAARQIAEQALSHNAEIMAGLIDIRADLARIERIAKDAHDQVKETNGQVTTLRLWKAEVKGIAQGAGGAGRLGLYMLGAASSTGGIVVIAMKILERP